MRNTATSISDIFTAFGGVRAFARAIELHPATVQYWSDKNRIPQKHWNTVIAAGKVIDLNITLETLFAGSNPVSGKDPQNFPPSGETAEATA